MRQILTFFILFCLLSIQAQEITIDTSNSNIVVTISDEKADGGEKIESTFFSDSTSVLTFFENQLQRIEQQKTRRKLQIDDLELENRKFQKAFKDFTGDSYSSSLKKELKDDKEGIYILKYAGEKAIFFVNQKLEITEDKEDEPRTGKMKIKGYKTISIIDFFAEETSIELIFNGDFWTGEYEEKKIILRKK